MLPAATTRPRFLLPLAVLLIAAAIPPLASRIERLSEPDVLPAPYRFFSAFAMLERVTCDQGIDRFVPNALQHDRYGSGYLFECNSRGFTIVSAGEDGIYGTDDDERSDR